VPDGITDSEVCCGTETAFVFGSSVSGIVLAIEAPFIMAPNEWAE
jgi:hypothetical protein